MTSTRKINFHARGFSLLEGAVALTILGIGLIMIAAIFPVALSQHRDSVDLARASELATKAGAVLKARFSDTSLWTNTDPSVNPAQWYMLPIPSLAAGAAAWDGMPAGLSNYANVINRYRGVDIPATNPYLLTAMDILSDRLAPFTAGLPSSPFTDDEFGIATNRGVWFGFYRKLDTLTTFGVAVCKQRRGQSFAEQDLSNNPGWSVLDPAAQNPYAAPTPISTSYRRIPVPWRVSVGAVDVNNNPQHRRMQLFNTANPTAPQMLGAGVPLGILAPRGSKLLVQGAVRSSNPGLTPEPPTTRILTVSDVLFDSNSSPTVIEVLEDIHDVPMYQFAANTHVTFDVWLFPPAIVNTSEFSNESPLLDWRFE